MNARRPLVAALLVVGILGGSGGAAVAAEDPDDGFSLTVTVLPSGGSPSPSPGNANVPGRGSGSPDTPVEPVADPAAEPQPEPALGESGVAGLLYVSGITSAAGWSWHSFGAALDTSISVRNASTETFYTTVRFWMDGPFGNRIATSPELTVRALKPGESRIVTARLDGAGQWSLVRLVAEVTPPDELAPDAAPLTREAWTPVFPWMIGVLVVLAAAAFTIVAVLRASRRAAMTTAVAASGARA